jgi:hypothetical protein
MATCRSCTYEARAGSLFCENCGNPLLNSDMSASNTRKMDISALSVWEGQGTTQINPEKSVLLCVRGALQPIRIEATHHSILLGRIREASDLKPDIDLTAFNAYEKGVSRIHATLRREQSALTLEDMGSANGTHVNGQMLLPGQRCVLRHGDEVRLGQLVTYIYFS